MGRLSAQRALRQRSSTMASRRYSAAVACPRWEVDPRAATRVNNHSMLLVVGFLALVAFACVLYLSQASTAAELRFRLGEREKEARVLWEQSLSLQRDIADAERLATIEGRAAKLGLVRAPASGPYVACDMPTDTLVARDVARPVATKPAEPAESLWQQVARRLGLVHTTTAPQSALANAGRP
jgi:hypothetical protein